MRFRRAQARQARLAVTRSGGRLPRYIRILLQTGERPGRSRAIPAAAARSPAHDQPAALESLEFVASAPLADGTGSSGPLPQDACPENVAIEASPPEIVAAQAKPDVPADTPRPTAASSGKPQPRQPVAAAMLEEKITEAVKAVPGCEAFVGVFVEKVQPKSRFGADWALRGVKFGRTDREKANEALVAIVARLQADFGFSDGSK